MVGPIDSVCFVLNYFNNTVGTKANKPCGERGKGAGGRSREDKTQAKIQETSRPLQTTSNS